MVLIGFNCKNRKRNLANFQHPIIFTNFRQAKTIIMFKSISFLFSFLIIVMFVSAQSVNPERQWTMYRGNYASGVLENANLPFKWDEKSGENIAWKTEIPGLGHSCPIIWGDNVFVTTAVSEIDKGEVKSGIYGSIGSVQDSSVHDWNLYCIDKHSGKIKWERTALSGVPE